jgi:hypothetical protein
MVLSYSAYVAEIYRSGIDSGARGPMGRGQVAGPDEWQTMRYAILPQALRNVLPALMNIVVALQKDVALLSVIGVRDAVREAQIYTATTFNYSALSSRRGCSCWPRSRWRGWPTGSPAATARAGCRGRNDPPPATPDRDRHVTKYYGRDAGARRRQPDVAPHEVVCLIGASGSGKSTLLRCINRLVD